MFFPLAMLSQYVFGPALFLISLFIVLIILLQRGRGGGLTGALGGAGGASAFGVKAGDIFTRITAVAVLLWIVLCALTCFWYLPSKLNIATTPSALSSEKSGGEMGSIGSDGGLGGSGIGGQPDGLPSVPNTPAVVPDAGKPNPPIDLPAAAPTTPAPSNSSVPSGGSDLPAALTPKETDISKSPESTPVKP